MAAPRVLIDALPEQVTPVGTNLLVVQDGPTTKKLQVGNLQSAALVSVAPSGNLTSTDTQAALVELQLHIDALEARVAALEAG